MEYLAIKRLGRNQLCMANDMCHMDNSTSLLNKQSPGPLRGHTIDVKNGGVENVTGKGWYKAELWLSEPKVSTKYAMACY